MSGVEKVILLACGSFNPVTNMHLRMFEIARDYLHKTHRYQVVGGIISPVNDAYGKKDLIPGKHRCAIVDLALGTNNWVRLDSWESDQDTWSETAKVLAHHKNILDSITNANIVPAIHKKQKLENDAINTTNNLNNAMQNWDLNQPTKLKLLCGADLLESFAVPGLWKEDDLRDIVGNYGIIVISREGSNPNRFIYESDLLTEYQHNIHIVTDWIPNLICATSIRCALRRGDSVKYLIPDAAIKYITEHGLYKTSNKYSSLLIPTNVNADIEPFYNAGLPAIHGGYPTAPQVSDEMPFDAEQETAV